MKNSLKSLIYGGLLALPFGASAQTFTETFGTVTLSTTQSIATASPNFVNLGFVYSTNASAPVADVRSTSQSTTGTNGYAGASALNNVFFGTQAAGAFFEIGGINTSTLTGLQFSFGVFKNVNLADGSSLVVSTSTNGTTYTALSHSLLPTGSGTSHWYRMVCTGSIPSTPNLRIRFTNTTTAVQYRIDDVTLAGGTCTSAITPSGSTFCSGGSTTLTATSGSAYLWTPGNFTTQSIVVNQSNTYNVKVTAVGGCTSNASPARVLVYPTPSVGIYQANICGTECATLTGRVFAQDLIISEYVEGSSNEKYVEIYNGTGAPINLAGYAYHAYHNGTVTPTFIDTLSGIINDGEAKVYANTAAFLYTGPVTSVNFVQHNGNDAIGLFKLGVGAHYVDIFGVPGVNPISGWTGTGLYSTLDQTLRRKSSVYSGITVNPNLPGQGGFTTLVSEWDQFPINDVSGLGVHDMSATTYSWSTGVVADEIVVCSAGVYTLTNATFDVSGCTPATATILVSEVPAFTAIIDHGDFPVVYKCFGPQCIDLTAFPSGTGPYTYTWSTGSTTDVAVVCPTVSSSYSVTVKNSNACVATAVDNIEWVDACCGPENNDVIVCFDGEENCLDSAAVQAYLDGHAGSSVGPCPDGGRMAAKSANTTLNNTPVLNVYPNPFNETATFEVKLTEKGTLKIEVMDMTGKKVAEVNNSVLAAGSYKFNWNGTNTAGNTVSNGLYFCRISTDSSVQTLKVQKTSDK